MIVETELKLLLPPDWSGHNSHAVVDRLEPENRSRGSSRKLHSTYFDTPSLDLAKRGMALRVRKVGRHWIQTLKAPASGKAGLQIMQEYEAELPNGQPSLVKIGNRQLARQLRGRIWSGLQPVFETAIERTAWPLTFHGSEIELAWDRGSIRAGQREEPVHELEMELKTGEHSSLFEAAEELLDVVPFRIGHSSKSARGYALAAGTNPTPQRAIAVDLSEDDTMALAFEKIVVGCMEQMHANEQSMLANGAVEAVHQFRVSLRRLRAIVGTYRELIDDNVHAMLSIDLRWAQRAFGPARDFDVYVSETLDSMLPHIPDDPAFQLYIDVANTARAKARREAMLALHNPRYSAMQLHIYRNLGSGAWRHQLATGYLDEPTRRFAASQLKALYKRMCRLGDNWRELSHGDLHRLRILGKRLRYVALAFRSLFKTKPANRFLDRIGAVQDCLGVLNDGIVGRRLTREVSGIAAADGSIQTEDLQRIQGMIEGWQAHAVHERLREFERVWNDFAAAKRFW